MPGEPHRLAGSAEHAAGERAGNVQEYIWIEQPHKATLTFLNIVVTYWPIIYIL